VNATGPHAVRRGVIELDVRSGADDVAQETGAQKRVRRDQIDHGEATQHHDHEQRKTAHLEAPFGRPGRHGLCH
jgi:hypothetical protein